MKTYLLGILKKLSRWRDILLLALVAAGVFFFVQKGQAVKELNPDEIWQTIWIDNVPPSRTDLNNVEETPEKRPLIAPRHASDIFKEVPLKEIEAISSNPIWTPAGDYTQLRARLEALKKDYQDAINAGDPKTAREKLTQYCKDDPQGRIVEWPNPPQTILTSLVCEQ